MCTATAARQAAPRYQMADTAYEMAREREPESFLEMCIAATMAAPQTIAAAVAAAPPAPLPVVKPAAVAKPPAPRSAPVAAPVARKSNGTPRLQKLSTRQIAVGLYTFEHAGSRGVVKNAADGWQLIINDIPGSRRYETKRHAVNAARLVMESAAAAAPAPVAPAAIAAAPVARPAPAPAPAPATGRRVSWRSAEAPWRREQMTSKQARHLAHLAGKMTACGLESTNPLATQAGLNRGEASDLIDSLKSQLSAYGRQPPRPGTRRQGCSIGPFANGYCVSCGLVQSTR